MSNVSTRGRRQRGMANTGTHAAHLHWLARQHLRWIERSNWPAYRQGPLKHHPQIASVVVMSAAAAEAGINEIILCPGHHVPQSLLGSRLLEKWKEVPALITGRSLDTSRSPWPDFNALVALRNEVMHFKWGSEEPPALALLHQKRMVIEPGTMGWLSAAMTEAVGRWSIDTVSELFDKVTPLAATGRARFGWAWGADSFPRYDPEEPDFAESPGP